LKHVLRQKKSSQLSVTREPVYLPCNEVPFDICYINCLLLLNCSYSVEVRRNSLNYREEDVQIELPDQQRGVAVLINCLIIIELFLLCRSKEK
jgi:hypothetical protein